MQLCDNRKTAPQKLHNFVSPPGKRSHSMLYRQLPLADCPMVIPPMHCRRVFGIGITNLYLPGEKKVISEHVLLFPPAAAAVAVTATAESHTAPVGIGRCETASIYLLTYLCTPTYVITFNGWRRKLRPGSSIRSDAMRWWFGWLKFVPLLPCRCELDESMSGDFGC